MRWNVRPRPRRARTAGLRWVMSMSPRCTVPALHATSPLHALNVVVFPAPFGPITPVMRPVLADSDRFSTAVTPPNCTVRFSTTSVMPAPRRSADSVLGALEVEVDATAAHQDGEHGQAAEHHRFDGEERAGQVRGDH